MCAATFEEDPLQLNLSASRRHRPRTALAVPTSRVELGESSTRGLVPVRIESKFFEPGLPAMYADDRQDRPCGNINTKGPSEA